MVSQDASDNVKQFIKWIYFSKTSQNIINNLALVSVGNSQTYLKSMLNLGSESIDVTESNFISLFFDYKNSDSELINNNWQSGKSFGISNSIITGKSNTLPKEIKSESDTEVLKSLKEIDFYNRIVKL